MEDHHNGMGPPKRSLDEIIENMTADLHDSDGQYIQLGFTPPPTPASTQHHWSPHSYLPPMPSHQPMYHPEHHPHPNEQPPLPSYLNSRSHSQPTLGGLIPGREMTEGNFVNFVYGSPMGLYVLNEPSNPGMQQLLNNYVPYRPENDYGLFMNNPTPPPTQIPERNNGLIENLVGNWSSTGSGTYSPFGNSSSPERVIEPLVMPEERVAPKKRMVAEVRPMRPSYSDVVSKSPPTKPRTLSPGVTKMEPSIVKPKVTTKKTVGKKAPGLKRQNSGEEGYKFSENARSPSPPPMVFRRRVSLDFDFEDSAQGDDDDERPDSAQDSSSQSGGDVSKQESDKAARPEGDRGMPLNNHKASRPGVAKRPLHINNNLNLPPRATEKNVAKGGRPCKTCGEERRGGAGVVTSSKGEGKAGPKTRSSSQGRDKPSQHASTGGGSRKGKTKKKDCPYSFSAMWPVLHRQLIGWAAVAMRAVTWFLHLLSDVLGMSSKLSWHLCGSVCGRLKVWSGDAVKYLRSALPLPRQSRPGWWSRWMPSWLPWGRKKGWEPSNEPAAKLENNLPLPGTGEEAMKRLLACRGKDPYSILGVAPTCTDDDIKRYYKRQAFLVHPDKNNQPGAEEAFKILVHAFDLIGEPEKRQVYDCGVARSHQAEAAWSELSDLLAQLHQKMEEAANTIRCTNCGKRHRRLPVERPCYAARNCAQCKIHHAAREGDIWAESSMMGFLWHYFACMEGAVYDITEWAACQAENLRHLRANSHAVQYRIVLGKKHQRHPPDPRRPDQNEPDFEDFLNSLYGQGGGGGGGGGARKDGEAASQSEHARKRKPRRKK